MKSKKNIPQKKKMPKKKVRQPNIKQPQNKNPNLQGNKSDKINELNIKPYEPIKNKVVFLILLVFSFILYGNTLQKEFGYVLDDGIVVSKNRFVQQGLKGIMDIVSYDTMAGEHGKNVNFVAGGRYRPASVVTFAIEWEFFSYGIWLPEDKFQELAKQRLPGFNPLLIQPLANKKYEDKADFDSDLIAYMGLEKAEKFRDHILKYTENAYGSPRVSHIVNILLYCLTAFLIYLVFLKLLKSPRLRPYISRWYFSIPFVASLLWLAHPVHTEVIANIKGRDEIMALLGAMAALFYTIKYIETKKLFYWILIFITFFIGMASKENAITFLAIIPLSFIFFSKRRLSQVLIALVPSIIASALFIYIRYKIIGLDATGTVHELMNNSFVNATKSQRYGTVFFTFIVYFRLMFFPHPLTWDYYPYHIPLVKIEEAGSLIPLMIYLSLLIYATVQLFSSKGKNNIYAYGIWFYFAGLSIVSNLFFSLGTFMSERFLYLPGIGFSIICAYFLVRGFPEWLKKKNIGFVKSYQPFLLSFLFLVLSLYTLKTVVRNTVWTDNYTLFTNDVKHSPNSAKGHTTAGEQLVIKGMNEKDSVLKKEYFETAIKYLHRAIDIHPRYIAARLDLGIAYEKGRKDYKTAIEYYISTIRLKPNYDKAYNNINVSFRYFKDRDFELETYQRLYKINPRRFDVLYRLGSIYGAYKNDTKKSILFLEEAIKYNPDHPDALTDLGVAYGISGQLEKAVVMLERAAKFNPDSPLIYGNLKASYKRLGNEAKANHFDKLQKETIKRLKQRSQRIRSLNSQGKR